MIHTYTRIQGHRLTYKWIYSYTYMCLCMSARVFSYSTLAPSTNHRVTLLQSLISGHLYWETCMHTHKYTYIYKHSPLALHMQIYHTHLNINSLIQFLILFDAHCYEQSETTFSSVQLLNLCQKVDESCLYWVCNHACVVAVSQDVVWQASRRKADEHIHKNPLSRQNAQIDTIDVTGVWWQKHLRR